MINRFEEMAIRMGLNCGYIHLGFMFQNANASIFPECNPATEAYKLSRKSR